jgi:transcriptional regulator with XRE-family HTH domain
LDELIEVVNARRSSKLPVPPAVALRGNLAKNVRAKRLDAGLTQRELGDLVNISKDYVRQIESGMANVSIDILNVLGEHFSTPAIDLLLPPKTKSRT